MWHQGASLVAQMVKNPTAMWETWDWSLGWEDPWRRERLPTPVFWPGNSIDCGIHRVAKSWTQLSDSLLIQLHWSRRWYPLHYSCLENSKDRGDWWATVHGVARIRHSWATEHIQLYAGCYRIQVYMQKFMCESLSIPKTWEIIFTS